MARSRNIKPSFFKNEALAELSFECRLLFIGLWCLADREGLLEDRPKRIKMEVFPGDNVEVDDCLNSLAEHGFINRYMVGAERYIEIPKFTKHQNPHHKEVASTIPKPGVTPPMHEPKTPGLDAMHESSTAPKPEANPGQAPGFTPVEGGVNPADSLNLIPDSLQGRRENGANPRAMGTSPRQQGTNPRARKKQGTRCPEEFDITEPMASWAIGMGLPPDSLTAETEKFLDHHTAKGSLFSDWPAAWRTWIRNAVQFAQQARR